MGHAGQDRLARVDWPGPARPGAKNHSQQSPPVERPAPDKAARLLDVPAAANLNLVVCTCTTPRPS
jgi:hypothetical protein